MSLLLC